MLQYRAPTHMHWLHAFDLGKWKVGVASALVGTDGVGRIYFANTVEVPRSTRLAWTPESVALATSAYLDTFASDMPEVLVCEWPQKYAKFRVAHANLDELHAVGKAIAGARRARYAKKWTPGAWKGGAPKGVHWARNLAALTQVEQACLDDWLQSLGRPAGWLSTEESHDTRDAISLGLFALGRVRRGGLPP